ncbi:hypothetical protein PN499_24520 [Kamptonema animale CS-326]|jgi:hypothetical protein|uniref:hypothetical protein n=1 Tax=Kamptonema animale TaxID=92934 RepID=UPI00232BC8C9|nr:hypothetical protein [Kamptonema animale]MDB9514370.1 hypothetical protein [Kamptonema animale CS-326]
MVQRIKLMADFDCYPLWDIDDAGDIDPTELPLSEETIERLLNWQKIYDGIIDWDDPALAGFASEQEKIAFEREGISLWQQLQKELGDEYQVVYKNQFLHRVVIHRSELKNIHVFHRTYAPNQRKPVYRGYSVQAHKFSKKPGFGSQRKFYSKRQKLPD